MINCVDFLFSGKTTTMFANHEKYIIHKKKDLCASSETIQQSKIDDELNKFLALTYPKNKTIPIVLNILSKKNLINEDLFFNDFLDIHVADFCSFLNNRFGEKNKNPVKMIKFCKYLNNLSIKIPKLAIKNPVAYKILN